MFQLVLLRHGESEWNKENLFTGWTDVPLSDNGLSEAKNAGKSLLNNGFDFDICYTSYLKRAIDTLNIVLSELDREWLPVIKNWKLNERHYGALQGLNKADTAEKYGEDQVLIWRRSYDVPPPILKEDDPRNPKLQAQYRGVDPETLPLAESLKTTIDRVCPYFFSEIEPQIREGKRVLITAHGNSLRGLVKVFDKMTDEAIVGLNIPTGIPLVYEFDDQMEVIRHYFLGNKEEIAKKMAKVANQGKKN